MNLQEALKVNGKSPEDILRDLQRDNPVFNLKMDLNWLLKHKESVKSASFELIRIFKALNDIEIQQALDQMSKPCEHEPHKVSAIWLNNGFVNGRCECGRYVKAEKWVEA